MKAIRRLKQPPISQYMDIAHRNEGATNLATRNNRVRTSCIFEIQSVPILPPVPPTRECLTSNPEGGVKDGINLVTSGWRNAHRLTPKSDDTVSTPLPPSERRQVQHRRVRHLPCKSAGMPQKTHVVKMIWHTSIPCPFT